MRTREKLSRRLKAQQPCEDRTLLLTAILADAINLGITKMAEACPGTIARKLDWLASLHIRDETFALAIAELVNIITGTHSPSTGVKGRHLRPMGSVFAPVAAVKRLAMLIFVMATNLLHAHFGPIHANLQQGNRSHRSRCHVCFRRIALPRI